MAGDGVSAQLSREDTLDDRGVADPLDEGYSPPDREPSVRVPTQSEEAAGESLDERLAQEEPDINADNDSDVVDSYQVGDSRAGRLVDGESDGISDVEKDLVAEDVGIDGAGASAEEAAVHVISGDPSDEEDDYPDGELSIH
ncbi:MAG: DUF5709 domain-containing protein [Actinomycetota bacterium]|nr:DUF5709 domain-containing protein [Actinomycetota bacterium]